MAVPFGVAGGLMLGIAAWRRRGVEAVLSPILDAMQTVPVFAYLLPILILFGFGPVAAMIATLSARCQALLQSVLSFPTEGAHHAPHRPRRSDPGEERPGT